MASINLFCKLPNAFYLYIKCSMSSKSNTRFVSAIRLIQFQLSIAILVNVFLWLIWVFAIDWYYRGGLSNEITYESLPSQRWCASSFRLEWNLKAKSEFNLNIRNEISLDTV